MSEPTFIYFAQMQGSAVIKIGRAKNPAARVASFSTGNPFPLALLGCIAEKPEWTEGHVHRHFENCRLSGEWFILFPELQSYLTSHGIAFDWNAEIKARALVDWVRCLSTDRLRRYAANAESMLADLRSRDGRPSQLPN